MGRVKRKESQRGGLKFRYKVIAAECTVSGKEEQPKNQLLYHRGRQFRIY